MRYVYFVSYAYKKWGRWHLDNTSWETETPIKHVVEIRQFERSHKIKIGKRKVTVLNVQLIWAKENDLNKTVL